MALGATIVEYAMQLARAGTSAALAIAIGTTPDAAARIGFHADTTGSAEKLGLVVGGIAGASVEVTGTDLRFRVQTGTRDGIALVGRAGGTSSYVATITPTTLTASRTWTGPDADITVAGINLAQTWTAAQNFNSGTTTIATADINGGAIDGTAIGAASPSTVASTTLTATTSLTVASDTDATTILGRARIASPVTDEASFGHFDQSANPAITQLVIGRTVVNATSGQELRFATGGITRGTITSTSLTLASGVNLAMFGASTFTMGTGASTFGGTLVVSSTASSSTASSNAIYSAGGIGSAGTAALRNVFSSYTTTDSNGQYALDFRRISDTAVSGAHNSRGFFGRLHGTIASGQTNSGSWSGGWVESMRNYVSTGDTGTLSSLAGMTVLAGHFVTDASTPTTTTVKGLQVLLYRSTGTIGTAYGIHIDNGSTTVTPTTAYGLKIEDTLGTTAYAIYTGTGIVRLGGALRLGNAYVATPIVPTGYVTIQDSTGTTYRVPVIAD